MSSDASEAASRYTLAKEAYIKSRLTNVVDSTENEAAKAEVSQALADYVLSTMPNATPGTYLKALLSATGVMLDEVQREMDAEDTRRSQST